MFLSRPKITTKHPQHEAPAEDKGEKKCSGVTKDKGDRHRKKKHRIKKHPQRVRVSLMCVCVSLIP
jgi:hypothetical protein